jgi:outer membrane protein
MLENAIANLLGLDYNDNIKIKYKKDEIMQENQSLQKFVRDAYKLNPYINSIKLALKIKDEQIKEVEADNYPMVNIFGNVSNTYNSYEYGYLNEDNRNRWSIGIAIKLSLFDGFKTRNKILEKKLDKRVWLDYKKRSSRQVY